MHPHIQTLLTCIDLEEKEQANRYKLDQTHNRKRFDAVFSIDENEWNGNVSTQLRLKSIQ